MQTRRSTRMDPMQNQYISQFIELCSEKEADADTQLKDKRQIQRIQIKQFSQPYEICSSRLQDGKIKQNNLQKQSIFQKDEQMLKDYMNNFMYQDYQYRQEYRHQQEEKMVGRTCQNDSKESIIEIAFQYFQVEPPDRKRNMVSMQVYSYQQSNSGMQFPSLQEECPQIFSDNQN